MDSQGPPETPAPRGKVSPVLLETEATMVTREQKGHQDLQGPRGEM